MNKKLAIRTAQDMEKISSISPEKEECKFNARILRMWTLPSYNNPEVTSSMELVLMDAYANKIHASIPNKLLDEFIGKLREGLVYSFRFFDIRNNVGKYRTTRHQYCLNFQAETEVALIPDKEIPFYGFSFVTSNEFTKPNFDYNNLIDIIGKIDGCYPVIEFEKNGEKCKRMVIDLLIDGKKFDCTLFGHYVDEFNSYFANEASKNNVLVVQYSRVKTFRGKTQLQNSMYSTKLFFNPDIPEVNELRNCKNENQVITHSLSQKSNYGQTSVEEDFLHQNKRISIEKLKDCEHEKYVVIKATIKHIVDSDDWWYPACKCNRSLIQRSKLYYCESCKHHLLTAIPRYRIKVRATDESDFVSLVIFDDEGSLILNRTCSEFIDILDKNNTLHIPPAQLLELVDKTFLFKVELKKDQSSKYEACYRVNRLTDDASIIQKFTKLLSPNNLEVEESVTKVIKTNPQKTEIAKMNSKDLMTDFTASIDDELKFEEVKQKRKYDSPSITQKAPFKRTYTRKKGTADGEASDVPNNKIIKKIKKEKI